MNIEPSWEECGDSDPATRLLATICVHGCFLHLEARQVEGEGHLQTFVEYPEDYEALCVIYSSDGGSFSTFERNGREYVAFAIPFRN
jgi:hypothetical protein